MPPPDGLTEARGAAFLEALAYGRESRLPARALALFDAGRWSAVAEITFRACAGSVGALVPACDPALDFFQDLVN